ncbi:hypothetical protein, partial [Bacillus thuringiensis]|uniref:hypothetical protein n=1 Tax=Bacillus thuringiensis TaxID=1428 RepID=UPI001CA4C6CB
SVNQLLLSELITLLFRDYTLYKETCRANNDFVLTVPFFNGLHILKGIVVTVHSLTLSRAHI